VSVSRPLNRNECRRSPPARSHWWLNRLTPIRKVRTDEKHVWETDTLPAPVVGRDRYRQTMEMYITAFPDLRFSVDQLLCSGDYVVETM
jgi:SnoaL-like polyketide cyclase